MKNKVLAVAALLTAAMVAVWFGMPRASHAQSGPSMLSRVGGVYFAPAYANWGGFIFSGNSATGSQTITVCANGTLADGRQFNPFASSNSVFSPITVDPQGSVAETVTPTAVTQISTPAGVGSNLTCSNVTASFSNVHGSSFNLSQVISGDAGIEEAVNDAAANGGGSVYYEADTGVLTLNTGGTTTTSTVKVPTASYVGGASCRVTTTITTAANYSLGISGATTAYINTSTILTAGSVQQITFLAASGTKVGTTVVPGVALSALLVTTNAAAGAGAVHCKAWGTIPVQSAF